MIARKPTVLVTGASGMLGRALLAAFKDQYACLALSRGPGDSDGAVWLQADLLDAPAVAAIFRERRPQFVVHCAAMTDVDACEQAPRDAQALHVDATGALAALCRESGARLVYISTDSVFDGRKSSPYREEDPPNPLNVYARTKLEGEALALEVPGGLVLRTNIFGWRPGPRPSFAEWILDSLQRQARLTMFTDVLFSPISTPHFASLLSRCLDTRLSGLYHAAGTETLSKHEFALRLALAHGLSANCVVAIRSRDRNLSAPRPGNMALDSTRLGAALGISLPNVAASLSAWKAAKPGASTLLT